MADNVSGGALVAPPQSGSKGSGSKKQDLADTNLRHHLAAECDAMARYAFARGIPISASVLQSLDLIEQSLDDSAEGASLEQLGQLHIELADVVAPAMPQTILLLHRDKSNDNWLSSLGPLPAVRRLLVATLLFTLTFVLVSMSGAINHENMAKDLYSMDGLALLQVLVFLMSAAGMGACFHALFVAHNYIGDGTYDPRYDSSYWTRVGLGVIAGLIMSQLVPIGPEAGGVPGAENGEPVMSKPILALLGGFSATMVYTVLERLVETVESLFKGKPGTKQPASDPSSTRTRLDQELARRSSAASATPATAIAGPKGATPALPAPTPAAGAAVAGAAAVGTAAIVSLASEDESKVAPAEPVPPVAEGETPVVTPVAVDADPITPTVVSSIVDPTPEPANQPVKEAVSA